MVWPLVAAIYRQIPDQNSESHSGREQSELGRITRKRFSLTAAESSWPRLSEPPDPRNTGRRGSGGGGGNNLVELADIKLDLVFLSFFPEPDQPGRGGEDSLLTPSNVSSGCSFFNLFHLLLLLVLSNSASAANWKVGILGTRAVVVRSNNATRSTSPASPLLPARPLAGKELATLGVSMLCVVPLWNLEKCSQGALYTGKAKLLSAPSAMTWVENPLSAARDFPHFSLTRSAATEPKLPKKAVSLCGRKFRLVMLESVFTKSSINSHVEVSLERSLFPAEVSSRDRKSVRVVHMYVAAMAVVPLHSRRWQLIRSSKLQQRNRESGKRSFREKALQGPRSVMIEWTRTAVARWARLWFPGEKSQS